MIEMIEPFIVALLFFLALLILYIFDKLDIF